MEGWTIEGWIVAFILLVFALVAVLFIRHLNRRKRYDVSKISLRDIDRMDGHEFEDYLVVLLTAIGFDTYPTKKSRDFGADLLFLNDNGERVVVQAKRYQAKLGLGPVQEVYSAKSFYEADQGLVITSAEAVTESCWKLASKTGVGFLLREDMEELISHIRRGRLDEAAALIETPVYPEKAAAVPKLEAVESERGRVRVGEYFFKGG
ncbi:restriction endonuclease [Shouchella shacheensis]|uniref:restriction endonuclease n=1 Tax=Shouchella shacheensis TaxID=1649580 RepID=UPI00073FDA5E|nr:restriction endonuclease [Shouchella shacheensis]